MCHEVMNQTDATTESKENHLFSSTKPHNQLIINKFIFVCRQKEDAFHTFLKMTRSIKASFSFFPKC